MGVRAIAPAVHKGADGSIHYLSSTGTGSLLIIADPAYGAAKAVKIPLDGPCRLVPRSPNLPAGYRGVEYESVSAAGSTLITVSPGRRPFEHTIVGVCSSCMAGEHDFELWPVCPSGNRHKKRDTESVDEPGTSAAPSTPPDAPAKGKARVRRLDAKKPAPEPGMPPAPAAEPILSRQERRDLETRWGPGPGAYW